jgi:hypothetical protein
MFPVPRVAASDDAIAWNGVTPLPELFRLLFENTVALRQNSHRLNCIPPVRSVKYPPENTSTANIGAPHNMEFASSTSEKMTFIAASRTQRLTSLLRCYSWRHIFIQFLLPNFILFCALCCFSVIKNIPIIKKM